MKCDNCEAQLTNPFFCISCGKYIAENRFKNEDYIYEMQSQLKTIMENADFQEHTPVIWDSTVDSYVKTFEKLRYLITLSNTENKQTGSADILCNTLDTFIEMCISSEFQIAFVGTIKAGKSTLINAILGKNLASTSVTPETAVLTKFRYSTKNYVKVKFYSDDEWNELWQSISGNADVFMEEYRLLNGEQHKNSWIGKDDIQIDISDDNFEEEIERWTSSKKVEHYFVKEVEVGMKSLELPEQVVLVDTPGLDDAVKYRSDVTRRYIDRANAVFACVKSDTLTGNEMAIITRVFNNTSDKNKIYIIGTQWDTLNNPVEDWKVQKANWIKYLSGETTYNDAALAEENIIYAAARVENLCRDYDILSKENKKQLTKFVLNFDDIEIDEIRENLPKLREIANIDTVKDKIKNELVVNYKKYLMCDIKKQYVETKNVVKNYFNELKQNSLEIMETSNKSDSEINIRYEQVKDELQKINEYKNDLSDIFRMVREDTANRIDELSRQLQNMI